VLQETVTNLSEAQRIAHLGNWDLDLLHNEFSWSDEIYRIFEIAPEKLGASFDALADAIHPDDRAAATSAYANFTKSKTPYSIDYRLLFPDGRVKYVHEQCGTIYDSGGKPLSCVGTIHDITARKQAEHALRRLNRTLRTLSAANTAVMRATTEEELLHEMCRVGVEFGGYRLAWIGFVEQDEAKTVRPVA
jgi:hypothetical protein